MTSAFSRRAREGQLSPEEYARLQAAFRGDCSAEYRLVPLNVSVINMAAGLLERHPLRTLDALHLATGLLANQFLVGQGVAGLTFVSADDRLLAVAGSEGLAVNNPNHYPIGHKLR